MGQRRRRCCPGDRGLPAGGRAHWLSLPRAGPPGAAPIGCAAAASCCGDRGRRGAAPDPPEHRGSPGTAAHRAPRLTGHRCSPGTAAHRAPRAVPVLHSERELWPVPTLPAAPTLRPAGTPGPALLPARPAAPGAAYAVPEPRCAGNTAQFSTAALPAGGASPSRSRSV
ncbi:putative uncharacterized protein MGC34800 [Molothrus aeneus]|uniref:putative uncharacterized protein MGC34800 n=1 Tax=Molothrus aeneus TaxID=84833 RepID=UPI00345A6305